MTERLYDQDAYQKQFTARVMDCVPEKDKWAVTLDRTAFYPEGGGQPGDIGTLGGAAVLDTHERAGEILHFTDRPLTKGETVAGEIDWAHRFSLMQNHSGEHLVSGWVHQLFGFDNVGFHMGHDVITLDFNGELDTEQLARVEQLANQIIYDNLPIEISYPSPEILAGLAYRSKKALTGAVRIVTAAGCDTCACCGTHVKRTGEIGMIKLLSAQRYKGGVRVSILCGSRARMDYGEKNERVTTLSVLFSAKPAEIVPAAERLLAENAALAQKNAALQKELFLCKANALPEGTDPVYLYEENLAPDGLRRFCLLLSERRQLAAVISGSANTGFQYAIGSTSQDVRPLVKSLNQAFAGRGGGAKELSQGTLSTGTCEEIFSFLKRQR